MKLIPQIRFKGFTDDWEERKLGEVFQQTVEYIDPKEVGLELWSVTVENGLTPKSERYNREFLVKKNDKFKAIHPDEIVYNPMNMTLGSIGFNNSGKNVAVSGYYVTMKLNKGFDSKYFATWLPSPNAINLYKLYATGSLIERQRVQFPTLSGIKTLMPILNEQKQIGLFFKQLDDTIALHQRKLDLVKETKKGFLQKMFPKNGEKVPEIRFPGFTEDWEERKLSDISNVITKGTTPKDKTWTGSVNYVKTESIDKNSGNISVTANTNIEEHEGYLKRSQLKEGDILFSIVGTLGRVGLVKISDLPANTNQQIAIIRLKNEINNLFIFQFLRTTSVLNFIKSDATIGAQPSLSLWQINNLNILIPKELEEQQKIGSFFKQIDDTIALHQRKLDLLKETKKGFLQKMF
ncbi:restriction endonuclease subunit S [Enterococcus mundtii]|uniref:restriction endonuclease subunit S n=1 Tax=Enterococcus mundtii TaxID=53346 RepID=UPI0018995B47|nr:restriction endonuclease subunit S [Enterococcus mundtii]